MALNKVSFDVPLIAFLFYVWLLEQIRLTPSLKFLHYILRYAAQHSFCLQSNGSAPEPGTVSQPMHPAADCGALNETKPSELPAHTPQGFTRSSHEQELTLLMCLDSGRRDVKLVQLDISNIRDDSDLLLLMRTTRATTAGFWKRLCGFRTVGKIRFVQFRVYPSCEDSQMTWAYALKANVIPPLWASGDEHSYIFEPPTTDDGVPIASETLVRWFRQPLRCRGSSKCMRAFPKLKGRLALTPGATEAIGWGVHIMEEEDNVKWCWLVVLLCFFSFIPGLVIYLTSHDLSGAFGASAYTLPILLAIAGTAKLWI